MQLMMSRSAQPHSLENEGIKEWNSLLERQKMVWLTPVGLALGDLDELD